MKYVERATWPNVYGAIRAVREGRDAPYKQAIARYLAAPDAPAGGGHALDVGCGAGHGALILKQKGYRVKAADKWDGGARLLFNEGIAFQNCDLDALSEPEGVYQLIVCSDVLEHVVNPARLLMKFRRWAHPIAGRLYVTVPIEGACTRNPFHLHSWTRGEFLELIGRSWQIERELKPIRHNYFWAICK